IDAKTLLHRVALVPDVYVKPRKLLRPFRRQRIDALNDDPVDKVVEHGPRVGQVSGVDAFPHTGRFKGFGCGRLEVIHELHLEVNIRTGTTARDMTRYECFKIESLD